MLCFHFSSKIKNPNGSWSLSSSSIVQMFIMTHYILVISLHPSWPMTYCKDLKKLILVQWKKRGYHPFKHFHQDSSSIIPRSCQPWKYPIASNIHSFSSTILASSIKKSLNGLPFLWEICPCINWTLLHNHDDFVKIINSQPKTLEAYQHFGYTENSFGFNLGPLNLEDLFYNKTNVYKL